MMTEVNSKDSNISLLINEFNKEFSNLTNNNNYNNNTLSTNNTQSTLSNNDTRSIKFKNACLE